MLSNATAIAMDLLPLQVELGWLHVDAMSRRRTPDAFSRELHAARASRLADVEAEIWLLQQYLPTEAAND